MRSNAAIACSPLRQRKAFTLVELLVVVAVFGILASMLLPALSKAKGRALSVSCINNVRQLNLAWLQYAHDQKDRLPYNLGGDAERHTFAPKDPLNWVNGVLDWELSSDNTNTACILQSSLATYCSGNPLVYRCPSDHALSDVQRQAGWSSRTRSYSMNAMVGNAGDLTLTGTNLNNPTYKQFFALTEITKPASIFVFLDEHPDSINDGYFLMKADYNDSEWYDLPASYHNGATSLSFADGHCETRKWINPETVVPPLPDAAMLPRDIPYDRRADFYWLLKRTSVAR